MEFKNAMFDLSAYLDSQCNLVNTTLESYLQTIPHASPLIDAMRYSLMAGGKRLRPVLCIAGCEAVGGTAELALPAACSLEMIHTYSLIHDDLPAMDDDALRRGKPTCHVQFGEATAILAGDALLTMAFQLLSNNASINTNHAAQWLTIIQRIARAAGCQGMVEGQMRDIDAENTALTQEELEQVHALKTGALIDAAIVSGAILGGASQDQLRKLEAYAGHIGLAFQVKDDVLNVEGDPSLLGKGVGTDALRQKSTYPSLMGLEASGEYASTLIDRALQSLASFDQRSEPLRAIAEYIITREF
jgi:geranylgeranyl diphosphate synthase type II